MVTETIYHLDGSVEIRDVPDQTAQHLLSLKSEARSRVSAIRWESTQSFTYDGILAPANSAMAALTGAFVSYDKGLIAIDAVIEWKLADNEFRNWGLDELLAYGAAVQAHIQECFRREAAFCALIDAAQDQEALDAIDFTEGWPS